VIANISHQKSIITHHVKQITMGSLDLDLDK